MTFYTGDRFPQWKRSAFVGGLREGEVPRSGQLQRVVFNENWEEIRREPLLRELKQRIRDVRQGPDGLLYVLTSENPGAVLRLEPAADDGNTMTNHCLLAIASARARRITPAGLVLAAVGAFAPAALGEHRRDHPRQRHHPRLRQRGRHARATAPPRSRSPARSCRGPISIAIWIVCTPARDGRAQPGCDAAPASHELVVRLTHSTPTAEDGNRRAFGYSLIDPTTATGTLSTVYVDRVDWLASTGQGGARRRSRTRHRARARPSAAGVERSHARAG